MDSLNILFYIRFPPEDERAGGGELVNWGTVEELARRGHNVTVLCGESGAALPEIGVEYVSVGKVRKTTPVDVFASLKLLKKTSSRNFHILHAINPEIALAGIVQRRYEKIPLIYEVHFPRLEPYRLSDALRYEKKLRWLLFSLHLRVDRLACKTATRILTPSTFLKERIVETYKIQPEKVLVVPDAVDHKIFCKKKQKQKPHKIISVGRLEYQKGYDTLLKAFKKIREYYPKARLDIVGDGPLREKLDKPLKGVTFSGFKTQEGVSTLLNQATLYVSATRAESFGMSHLEAMAAELPIVSTDAGAIPELISDGVNGFLVPVDDPKALADKTIQLLGNPRLQRKFAKAGQKKAKGYTYKKRVDEVEKTYESIV